jgi:hypothetical protein
MIVSSTSSVAAGLAGDGAASGPRVTARMPARRRRLPSPAPRDAGTGSVNVSHVPLAASRGTVRSGVPASPVTRSGVAVPAASSAVMSNSRMSSAPDATRS